MLNKWMNAVVFVALVLGGCGAEEMEVESLSSPVGVCGAVRCAEGTRCVAYAGRALCIPLAPCAQTACAEGQHCELQQVECVTRPCAPQPTCVSEANPCAAARCAAEHVCVPIQGRAYCVAKPTCADLVCAAGQRCALEQVNCVKAPCYPIPMCR